MVRCIDRRILVNFRAEPDVIAQVLPKPFRPHIHNGCAVVGICLIRFVHMRPSGLPGFVGTTSENAAHRFAVEWDQDGAVRSGVYIPRRDTNSRINALVGGKIFPGSSHYSHFDVTESDDRYDIAVRPEDASAGMRISAGAKGDFPADSIFSSLDSASDFFKLGSVGYSATSEPGRYDGLELRCQHWRMEPLSVTDVHSSYFQDASLFPPLALVFDNALLMRRIQHQWIGLDDIRCG
jgi:hypothetical protein